MATAVAASDDQGGGHSSVVCALVSNADRLFGFAIFDEERRRLQVCEYRDDSHLSRTEGVLLQVQPRECCVLMNTKEDSKRIGQVTESCGVLLGEAKKDAMKQVDTEQDLMRLLADAGGGCGLSRHLEEQRQKQGMKALMVLFAQFQLLSEPANFGACELSMYPLATVMRLDKAAFSALNILPRSDESWRSPTTLLGFLNRCRSNIGTRRLRQWLTQPLTSVEEVTARHDIVEAFMHSNELLRQVEGSFRYVPDLDGIAARLHRTSTKSKATKASLEDLINVYQCVRSMEPMLQKLKGHQGTHSERVQSRLVEPLQACLADFSGFKALIEQTMDLKQAEQQRTYCVSMTFAEALRQLAAKREKVREQMEDLRTKVDEALKLPKNTKAEKGVALVDCPEGQAFRVTKKHQQTVMGAKISSYTFKVLAIKKQEFIFTVSQLEKYNAELKAVISTYDQQSSQLADKTLKVAATYCPVVERFSATLSALDVLAAFARAALNAPCNFVRPQLDPDGKQLNIKGAAHVLVLAHSERGFVANDLDMDNEDSRLHIITGPNMGGKSTYIRSVALIALLNQIGSFVPCQAATLPLFDAIMCRVGASDMQLRGISTYMAEMLEAACILNTATSRSLVIVDELGRGTSTADGFGVAWAIAKYLAEDTRCFSLFATHFHELAVLEERASGIKNRHATAAVDPASGKLTFLYALHDGPSDQSYGIHVAELAGFPDHVVEAAREQASVHEENAQFGRPAKRQRVDDGLSPPTSGPESLAAAKDDFMKQGLGVSHHLHAVAAA